MRIIVFWGGAVVILVGMFAFIFFMHRLNDDFFGIIITVGALFLIIPYYFKEQREKRRTQKRLDHYAQWKKAQGINYDNLSPKDAADAMMRDGERYDREQGF